MVKSISFSFANAVIFSNSIAPMGTHSAIMPMPALPGAQYILSTAGLFATLMAIACSLPPLPTINTFMFSSPLFLPVNPAIVSLCRRQSPPWQFHLSPWAVSPIPPAPSLCAEESPACRRQEPPLLSVK